MTLEFSGVFSEHQIGTLLDVIHDQWYHRNELEFDSDQRLLKIPFKRTDEPHSGYYLLYVKNVKSCVITYGNDHVDEMFNDLTYDPGTGDLTFDNMLGEIKLEVDEFNIQLIRTGPLNDSDNVLRQRLSRRRVVLIYCLFAVILAGITSLLLMRFQAASSRLWLVAIPCIIIAWAGYLWVKKEVKQDRKQFDQLMDDTTKTLANIKQDLKEHDIKDKKIEGLIDQTVKDIAEFKRKTTP